MFVVGDFEARVKRLVRESPVAVIRARVSTVGIGEEPQRVVEERPPTRVSLIMLTDALLDIGEPGADAVLVSLQGGQVDGVGEVRGEEFVTLNFQACPFRCQVNEFLVAAHGSFVERGIDCCGELTAVSLADGDVRVGVRDQSFRNRDGYRTPGTVRLLRGTA